MGNCCKGTSFGGKSGEYTLPPEVDDTPIVKNNASFRKSKAILDLNPLPTDKANESSTEKDQTMALVSYQQSPKIQNKSVVHSDQDDTLEIHTAPNEDEESKKLTSSYSSLCDDESMKKQVIFDKNHHIISVEVANNDTKSSASSETETEPLPTEPEMGMPLLPDDLPGLPKVSWDQKDIAIVLDPSMIPPEHDNNYPIIGGIAVHTIDTESDEEISNENLLNGQKNQSMNDLISHSCSSLLEKKNKEPDIKNEPQVAETFEEPAEEPIYATVMRP